jgi:peptidoglycan/xylan/chitin deacetylase (PgdA/CDA1 family)
VGLPAATQAAESPGQRGVTSRPSRPAQADGCSLSGGFELIHALIPEIVGECLEVERQDEDGNLVQATTGGLLVYRPADNWTAFTDGLTTWVNGPCGLQSRPNADLFTWEQGGTCEATGLGLLPDAPLPPLSSTVRCALLYQHEVSSRVAFEAQVSGLLRRGYQYVSLQAIVDAMSGGPPLPRQCLVLTFDDALMSQFENAKPVLDYYRVPAVFFAMPAFADGVHRYMGATELQQLAAAGYEIASHTVNHANLPALRRRNPTAFQAEIVESRRQLEQITGRPVHFLAYPDGAADAQTATELVRVGYWLAFTTQPGTVLQPGQRLLLPRIQTQSTDSADAIVAAIAPFGGTQ